jgi:excisionase family DNA binding protein
MPTMTEDFISVDDIAKALDTDRKTIYGAIERKEIPCIRIGRLIRVPGAWLRRAAGLPDPDKTISSAERPPGIGHKGSPEPIEVASAPNSKPKRASTPAQRNRSKLEEA